MKLFISFFLLLHALIASNGDDPGVSFINATKTDNLIILGRIISRAPIDSTKDGCPPTMTVEVIEVLKGKESKKEITVTGQPQLDSNSDLACLFNYIPGQMFILGLDSCRLRKYGNHSLEYKNDIVIGTISIEPTEKWYKEYKKLLDKWMETPWNKRETLRKKLDDKRALLEQKMNYKVFKSTYEELFKSGENKL